MAQITLTKFEAAERQLVQAIRLFFGEGDEVSTHALTCAAHDVLRALAVRKGTNSPLYETTIGYVRPDKVTYLLGVLRAPQNFIKHADHDPDAVLTFSPEATQWLIFDACVMHSRLAGYHRPETYCFFTWVYLEHPDLLLDGPAKAFFTSPLAQRCRITVRGAVLDAIDWLRSTQGDRIPINLGPPAPAI